MFSSHTHLKRKTPDGGINRKAFIEHLVEEYHTTTNIEAQEQVAANLANFAYDPINWTYLKQADALQLFVNILVVPNQQLQLFGVAGLCNICSDKVAQQFIVHDGNLPLLLNLFLTTENKEILLNCITLFQQLVFNTSVQLRQKIATPNVLQRMTYIRQTIQDQRLHNLIAVFLEDYGSRTETIQLPNDDTQRNAADNASVLQSTTETS